MNSTLLLTIHMHSVLARDWKVGLHSRGHLVRTSHLVAHHLYPTDEIDTLLAYWFNFNRHGFTSLSVRQP